MRLASLLCLVSVAMCAAAIPADAALELDSNTSGATLAVSADGKAQVTWMRGGVRRSAVITGSTVRYAGKIAKTATAVRVTPTIPFALVQLRLPNGQQFALQQVNRVGQFGQLGPPELYVSRWSGDPTSLTITEDAAGRVCGTVTYHGAAVYGSAHTSSGNPLDALGRNVYLDSLRSTGWYRMLGVLSRPLGWAFLVRSEWVGTRYRGLVVGPNDGGDLAPVASAETAAAVAGSEGTCPFPAGTYKGA